MPSTMARRFWCQKTLQCKSAITRRTRALVETANPQNWRTEYAVVGELKLEGQAAGSLTPEAMATKAKAFVKTFRYATALIQKPIEHVVRNTISSGVISASLPMNCC